MSFQSSVYDSVLSIDSIKESISSYLPELSFQDPIGGVLLGVCHLAIFYYAGNAVIQNVLRGGESFSFDIIRKPFFFIIILNAWPYIADFVFGMSEILLDVVSSDQNELVQISNEALNGFSTITANMEGNLNAAQAANTSVLDPSGLTGAIEYLDDFMILKTIQSVFELFKFIDAGIILCFYVVAAIWTFLIKVGGPIALTIYIVTGSSNTIINWAKSLVSVVLWVPVGSFIIGLLNSIMVKLVKDLVFYSSNTLNSISDMSGSERELLDPTLGAKFVTTLLLATSIFLLFVILKIILLGKTPQIISTWVGGGSSSGGGLAAAFLAVSAVKSVGSKAASAGAAVATKGVSKLKG